MIGKAYRLLCDIWYGIRNAAHWYLENSDVIARACFVGIALCLSVLLVCAATGNFYGDPRPSPVTQCESHMS